MSSLINEHALGQQVFDLIQNEIEKAVDEQVEEAIEKLRPEVRRRVAESILATVETEISVQRLGTDLRIILRSGDES